MGGNVRPFIDFLIPNPPRLVRDFPRIEIQPCPAPGVVTDNLKSVVAERRQVIPLSRKEASLILAHSDLECAVNVPYGDNWPSTFGYFCNPCDTFRASVFCGQAIDLNGGPGPIRTGDPLLRRQMLYPTELRARAFILSAQEKSKPDYATSSPRGS